MFGIDSAELLIIAVVALLVIGPKDLPRAMRGIGEWVGRARGMAKHFRSGLDTMMREAEFEELEKAWQDNNDKIMREYPAVPPGEDWAEPVPALENEAAAEAWPPPSNAAKPKAPPRRRAAPPIPAGPAAPPADDAP